MSRAHGRPCDRRALSGLLPEHIEVTGLPVNPVFGSNRWTRRSAPAPGLERRPLRGADGRSKRAKKLEPLAHVLNYSGLPLELAIAAGGDKELHSRLSEVEWHLPRARLWLPVDDMPVLMLAAIFIVCKAGGLIVSEALAAGLPLLLVEAILGQETGNAEYVEQGVAGFWWKMQSRALRQSITG